MGDSTAHRAELVAVSNADLSATTNLAWERIVGAEHAR